MQDAPGKQVTDEECINIHAMKEVVATLEENNTYIGPLNPFRLCAPPIEVDSPSFHNVPSWTGPTLTTTRLCFSGYDASYPKNGLKSTINGCWSFFTGSRMSSSFASCASHSLAVVRNGGGFCQMIFSVKAGGLPGVFFCPVRLPIQFLLHRTGFPSVAGFTTLARPPIQDRGVTVRIMDTKIIRFFWSHSLSNVSLLGYSKPLVTNEKQSVQTTRVIRSRHACRLWISTIEHPSDRRALDSDDYAPSNAVHFAQPRGYAEVT
jgi:hypothetical protein